MRLASQCNMSRLHGVSLPLAADLGQACPASFQNRLTAILSRTLHTPHHSLSTFATSLHPFLSLSCLQSAGVPARIAHQQPGLTVAVAKTPPIQAQPNLPASISVLFFMRTARAAELKLSESSVVPCLFLEYLRREYIFLALWIPEAKTGCAPAAADLVASLGAPGEGSNSSKPWHLVHNKKYADSCKLVRLQSDQVRPWFQFTVPTEHAT